MITFLKMELEIAWKNSKSLPFKTAIAEIVFDVLDVIDAASAPHDTAFIGFQFDEWSEGNQHRYGIMVSDHWLISYEWSDGHAIDIDLERLD